MRGTLRCLSVLSLILAAGCGRSWVSQRAQADFRETADLSGVTLAIIETQNGSVDADCAATGRLATITGTKHACAPTLETARQRVEEIKIVIERDAARPEVLHIKADIPRFNEGSAGAHFRLSLPPELAVTVRTSNGAAAVKSARGNVDIQTANGQIRAQALGADLHARTSNGGITAKGIAGNVNAASANGSITLEDVGRDQVTAQTSNSHIRVTDSRGDLKLTSSNGRIELKTSSLPATPHVQVQTSNSSARIELPRTAKATLHLATSNGRARARLTGAEVTDHSRDNSHVSARLNGGGGHIDITSSNGSVDFVLTEGEPTEAEKPTTAPAAG